MYTLSDLAACFIAKWHDTNKYSDSAGCNNHDSQEAFLALIDMLSPELLTEAAQDFIGDMITAQELVVSYGMEAQQCLLEAYIKNMYDGKKDNG